MNCSFRKFLVVGLVIWLQLAGGTALAATIMVDTALDVVAEDGLCSLREAITNANNSDQSGSTDCVAGDAGGNTIQFDGTLIGETITLGGEQLQISFRNLTIEGPVPGDASGLILDGDQASRVINISGPGTHVDVILRDLTLTGGRTEAAGQPGGALHAQSVSLTLDNVTVSGNSTGGNSSGGGGISGLQASIAMIDSTVEDNHVEGLATTGGGIYVRASELELIRTSVIDNHTTGGSNTGGGGIWAGYFGTVPSDLSLIDSAVIGNSTGTQTSFGGGIWAEGGAVEISGSTISGNSVTVGGAGGIHVNETQLTMRNSTVSGNSCSLAGGGMQIRRGSATLTHSTVAFNLAGGTSTRDIWVFGTSDDPASLELINSLIVQEDAAHTTCQSNDFATIIATGSLSTHESCTGVTTAPEDIDLLPLAGNGGPTRTHALAPASAAIDGAGDCVADHGVTVDQRGEPRPGGDSSTCDIGAFEQQESPPEADLAVELSVNPEEAEAGQTVTFLLEVHNLGPDTAQNASALFDLPDGFEFISATPNLGSYDSSTGVWTMGSLAASVVMTLQLEATLNFSGEHLATASASSETYDPDTGNNTDLAEVTLLVPQGPMIVNTLLDVVADDGNCSLREAIINANNSDQSGSIDCPVGNLILFDDALIGGSVELNGTQLPEVAVDLNIEGPVHGDPSGIAVNGQGMSRLFAVSGAVTVNLQDLTMTGGHTIEDSRPGGAIYIIGGAEVAMSRVHMSGNSTGGNLSRGGAVAVSGGSLALIDSEVSGNQTTGSTAAGGAISVENGVLLLDATTVAENQSSHVGGGLYIAGSTMAAVNSTLSGNATTQGGGGAMYLNRSNVSLTHVTVAYNATSGTLGSEAVAMIGDENDSAELSLNNSLLVGNACSAPSEYTVITSSGSMSTSSSCTGASTSANDIGLLVLGDNGGLTRTHALAVASAAIGFAGNCVSSVDIDSDQRGQPRPGGSSTACDVGAYEFQGSSDDRIYSDRFEASLP